MAIISFYKTSDGKMRVIPHDEESQLLFDEFLIVADIRHNPTKVRYYLSIITIPQLCAFGIRYEVDMQGKHKKEMLVDFIMGKWDRICNLAEAMIDMNLRPQTVQAILDGGREQDVQSLNHIQKGKGKGYNKGKGKGSSDPQPSDTVSAFSGTAHRIGDDEDEVVAPPTGRSVIMIVKCSDWTTHVAITCHLGQTVLWLKQEVMRPKMEASGMDIVETTVIGA